MRMLLYQLRYISLRFSNCPAVNRISVNLFNMLNHGKDRNWTYNVYHEGTDLQSAVTPPIVTAFPEDTFSGLFELNSSPQDKDKPIMEWKESNLWHAICKLLYHWATFHITRIPGLARYLSCYACHYPTFTEMLFHLQRGVTSQSNRLMNMPEIASAFQPPDSARICFS